MHELSLSPESVRKHRDMKIVYSPMHGAGVRLVPASLRKFGFTNVIMVKEQAVIDGNFPTVESPNPEERKTMSMAIDLAAKEGADLVLATDPDSDRIGVALRNKQGEYVLLNGNQTLVLLMSYQLTRWAERGELDGNQYVVKTIVTSQMANAVADYFKVKCYDCLTGFKYIAKIIRENEGKTKYIGGGEESFGYLAGDYVRDKDAVSACSLAAEAAAWAMDTMGLTLYEWLQQLYVKYGFYREGLVSVVRKGKEGAELIQKMMVDFRTNPPKTICGSPVVKVNDFLSLEQTDLRTGAKTPIEQDSSNVLQWFTEDGTIVSVRPSGTEPKIKFYFGVKAPLASVDDYEKVLAELDAKIEAHQEGPQAGVGALPCRYRVPARESRDFLSFPRGCFCTAGDALGGYFSFSFSLCRSRSRAVFLAKLASTAAVRSTPVWLARQTSTHSTSAISSARLSRSPALKDWSP